VPAEEDPQHVVRTLDDLEDLGVAEVAGDRRARAAADGAE
jgi:hypothetical protein